MPFVVVARTMGSIVVSFILVSVTLSGLSTGALAPPYHLNHFLLFIVIIFINLLELIILFVVVTHTVENSVDVG
jgi:hypothetical protein